jgi:hypothetical protein
VRQSLAAAAQGILRHLQDADEVAVAVFSSTGKVTLPFTTDRAKASAALTQASQMSSNEGAFLNESVYQVTTQLMSTASAGNRKAIICLTDGSVNVPSGRQQRTDGQSVNGIPLHTEEAAKLALLQAGTTFNAVIEKSALTYFIEASRHPRSADRKQYPPGSVKTYAGLTGGIVLESGQSNGATTLAVLLDDLRARYTLGYRPSDDGPTGVFCHLQLQLGSDVRIRLHDAVIETRQGYYR